jgi:hypothetical protein
MTPEAMLQLLIILHSFTCIITGIISMPLLGESTTQTLHTGKKHLISTTEPTFGMEQILFTVHLSKMEATGQIALTFTETITSKAISMRIPLTVRCH